MVTSASFRQEPGWDGSIALSEVISALCFAIDLMEGVAHGHALRSCLLGMRIAEEAGVSEAGKRNLYYALLLKDVGHGANTKLPPVAGQDLSGILDSGQQMSPGRLPFEKSRNRMIVPSDRSAEIAGKLGLGPAVAEAIRGVDERWDGCGPQKISAENIPLGARVCAVAQHLDLVATGRGIKAALLALGERSGHRFDPAIVKAAESLAARGALWGNALADDDDRLTRQVVLEYDGSPQCLDADQIDRVCEVFADVVDAKSHFTFRHSLVVAHAAEAIAMKLALSPERQMMVRRAALLHDLGKLSVSNRILDKKGWLNAEEWKVVRKHPGLTRQILERVGPFQEIAVIAGEHHEKLDGSGYPNNLVAKDLSLESRMVAVADVYGALSEDRPYRPVVKEEEIIAILTKLAPKKLDRNCVEALVGLISEERMVEFEPQKPVLEPLLKPGGKAVAMRQVCA